MNSDQVEQPPAERLPYEKPTLRSISLIAEEVLGLDCKKTSSINAYTNDPISCVTSGCQSY
jgi:hypothetical protein